MLDSTTWHQLMNCLFGAFMNCNNIFPPIHFLLNWCSSIYLSSALCFYLSPPMLSLSLTCRYIFLCCLLAHKALFNFNKKHPYVTTTHGFVCVTSLSYICLSLSLHPPHSPYGYSNKTSKRLAHWWRNTVFQQMVTPSRSSVNGEVELYALKRLDNTTRY